MWSAVNVARVLVIAGMIGSFTSPALANSALGAAAIVLAVARRQWPRIRQAVREPFGIGAVTLLAVMAAAMLWADADWKHRFAAWWHWRTLLLAVVASALFDDVRWKERFCLALIGALLLANVASFALWARGIETIGDPGIILRNHVTQGMAFTIGALFAVVLGLFAPRSVRARTFLLVSGVSFVGNIAFVCTGRSGQIALLVCATAGTLVLVRNRWRWVAFGTVPIVCATLLWASPMVRGHFTQVFEQIGPASTATTMTGTRLRLIIWKTTLEMIRSRPLLGYGVGGFAPVYAHEVAKQYTGWQAVPVEDPHNQYLRVAVESGLVGLAAFFGLILGTARQPAPQPYRACGLSLLAAWMVTSLFSSHFETFAEGHMIALTLGVLMAKEDRC
jgi:O-antigen ligase